jgi:mono/diheme cytochrome c family protein
MRGPHQGVRAILVGFALCSAFFCREGLAEPSAEVIAKGKALTEIGDCASCHTADSANPFAGGKRIDTPFGGIYSPNLTSDPDTGLGRWSDEDFVRALRYGIAPNGARYYPAFPYPNFTKLTHADILAIRGYLATLAPIRNAPPPPDLRWPLNYRALMRGWNYLFFKTGAWGFGVFLSVSANARKCPQMQRFS